MSVFGTTLLQVYVLGFEAAQFRSNRSTGRALKVQVRGWYNYCLFKRLHYSEWCLVHFSTFSSFDLRNYICQSAKKSFYTTSLHVDLNEAAKCVDIKPYTTHITSLLIAPSHTRTKYKMATIFGLTYKDSLTNL